jgi:hypothetical protein
LQYQAGVGTALLTASVCALLRDTSAVRDGPRELPGDYGYDSTISLGAQKFMNPSVDLRLYHGIIIRPCHPRSTWGSSMAEIILETL